MGLENENSPAFTRLIPGKISLLTTEGIFSAIAADKTGYRIFTLSAVETGQQLNLKAPVQIEPWSGAVRMRIEHLTAQPSALLLYSLDYDSPNLKVPASRRALMAETQIDEAPWSISLACPHRGRKG
jgi:hypothetical protein